MKGLEEIKRGTPGIVGNVLSNREALHKELMKEGLVDRTLEQSTLMIKRDNDDNEDDNNKNKKQRKQRAPNKNQTKKKISFW